MCNYLPPAILLKKQMNVWSLKEKKQIGVRNS